MPHLKTGCNFLEFVQKTGFRIRNKIKTLENNLVPGGLNDDLAAFNMTKLHF